MKVFKILWMLSIISFSSIICSITNAEDISKNITWPSQPSWNSKEFYNPFIPWDSKS